jgi:hypothetical protein
MTISHKNGMLCYAPHKEYEMASKAPNPQPDPNYSSPEECQEMFREFWTSPWEIDVPDYEKEILEQRIADYCENGVHMTPWEEFEKELFDMLMKG